MATAERHEIEVLDKGIHCEGCKTCIQAVLARMPGVREVRASHKTQRVELRLDPEQVSLRALRDKLVALGYQTAP